MINLILILCLLQGWTDFGYSEPIPKKTFFAQKIEEHFETNLEKIYIEYCYFQLLSTYDGYGGAIMCKSAGQILIEFSYFVDCTSTNYGGAIHQYNYDCILNKCCSIRCFSIKSMGFGQFLFSSLDSENNMKHLEKVINDINSGKAKLEEHELIEEE